MTHQTVERCRHRTERVGVMAALDDSPRPGRVSSPTKRGHSSSTSPAAKPRTSATTRLAGRGGSVTRTDQRVRLSSTEAACSGEGLIAGQEQLRTSQERLGTPEEQLRRV